jgi:hypothetical protein
MWLLRESHGSILIVGAMERTADVLNGSQMAKGKG